MNRFLFLLILFFLLDDVLTTGSAAGQEHAEAINAGKISYCDTSLSSAQKYVLKVDGKPYYGTNIQIRLDKLRYYWSFDATAREAVIAQAAADGFNTVSIPIHWYEVEPDKNTFNWTILDEYLNLANKYNLKVELLWFGANSGGHAQWLGNPTVNPVHLRTPDYVLYSSGPRSTATTSEYTIRRDMSDYTLDLNDVNLKARETYVLGQVMEHIASWDAANASRHTVIGVQLGNEVKGYNRVQFSASTVVAYLSDLGTAVKKSSYSVWTRINCVYNDTNGRIDANEALRSTGGTNIDFVGIDIYGTKPSSIRSVLPYKGGNYRMIMESGAEVSSAAIYQLAALSGNNAYDHYDMLSPDGHQLYDRSGTTGLTPHGTYVDDVRTANKLINSDIVDIAMNSQGYGLYVHNYAGNSTEATTGVEGISYVPGNSTSQGISIRRSNTEIVLMSTKGGTFTYPSSLKVKGATKGYFDSNNVWVKQGNVPYTKTSITVPAGTTVRLTRTSSGFVEGVRLQAEFADIGGGTLIESSVPGFAGNGYINFPSTGGYVQWTKVDGQAGGTRTIRFRYALIGTSTQTRTMSLTINGISRDITFAPSDPSSLEKYGYFSVSVPLNSGTTNTIRLQSAGQDGPNIDELSTY